MKGLQWLLVSAGAHSGSYSSPRRAQRQFAVQSLAGLQMLEVNRGPIQMSLATRAPEQM